MRLKCNTYHRVLSCFVFTAVYIFIVGIGSLSFFAVDKAELIVSNSSISVVSIVAFVAKIILKVLIV